MTIYTTVLGEKFQQLHPKLQHRYALPLDQRFFATGVMSQIKNGGRLLSPFYRLAAKANFLFPERGEEIPFSIANRCTINPHGEAEVAWERTFYFQNAERKFNARMTVDLEKKLVKDFLGDIPFLYSDLHFDVTKESFLLITSGLQKVMLGKMGITLPDIFRGRVTVLEGFDDQKDVYTIHVSIYNAVLGRVMMYAGEFKESVH